MCKHELNFTWCYWNVLVQSFQLLNLSSFGVWVWSLLQLSAFMNCFDVYMSWTSLDATELCLYNHFKSWIYHLLEFESDHCSSCPPSWIVLMYMSWTLLDATELCLYNHLKSWIYHLLEFESDPCCSSSQHELNFTCFVMLYLYGFFYSDYCCKSTLQVWNTVWCLSGWGFDGKYIYWITSVRILSVVFVMLWSVVLIFNLMGRRWW